MARHNMYYVFLFAILLAANDVYGQGNVVGFSKAIEDNSFLIEEAYNQEPGVVQHISNGQYYGRDIKFIYTFTQEWPITGYKHQLSYDISYLSSESINGVDAISVNYRYQLFYRDDWACVSPRLSLIIPTSNSNNRFGDGTFKAQINLPISKRISESLVTHFNLGSTYHHRIEWRDPGSNKVLRKSSFDFHVGGSIIWLTMQNMNLVLEWRTDLVGKSNVTGTIDRSIETIVNPGIRHAININNLQIVQGVSLPVTVGNDVEAVALFYLSFEHPLF